MIDERPARVVCHRPGPLNETGGAQGTAERIGSNELAAEGANQRRGSCRQPRRVLRKKKKIVSIFFFFFLFCPKRWTKRKQVVIPISSSSFHIYLYEKKKEQKRERRRFTWPDDGVATHPDRESLWSLPSSHLHPHSKRTEKAASPTGCTRRSYIRMLCTYIYICVCVYIFTVRPGASSSLKQI